MKTNRFKFTSENESAFFSLLRERVDAHFKENNLSKKADRLMILKSFFYLGGACLLYGLIMMGGFSPLIMLGLAMLLGFFMAGIGINIGHDACHDAYSSKTYINKLFSVAFELAGTNTDAWNITHNEKHHRNTKIVGWDGDLESMPLLRFYVKPELKWYHRYQHWYATFLYGFISLVWVFKKDFSHIFGKDMREYTGKNPPLRTYVSLIGFKLLHYILFLILPMVVLDMAVWQVLIGFFAMHYVTGLTLTPIFQLGHCVEGPAFVYPSHSNTIADTWAEHQLKTTANFSNNNVLADWICGGLNYQIEHHLFPHICHTHYPEIAPIVEQTAKEFGLPYYCHRNFIVGYRAHLRLLKRIGCTTITMPSEVSSRAA